jgi:hypothetical protein
MASDNGTARASVSTCLAMLAIGAANVLSLIGLELSERSLSSV